MKEIFAALAKAQGQFEAAFKSSQNPQFRSKYAALDACVDAVRPALNSNGIFLTQTIETVENGVVIETVFAHESGEIYVGGKLFMPVSKQDAQGYGSAISYGRRYSLLTACGVAPEEDDGNAAVQATTNKAPSKPFDIVAVLNKVESCKTESELQLVWGDNSVAANLVGGGAYGALKAACKDKKQTLQPTEGVPHD
jgi:hypothetical protein